MSDARESTNRVKKRCHQAIILQNRGFSREKGVIYDITDSKIVRKIGKIVKSWSKKVIRNFGRENGNFFLKNVIQKS